jgi:hypothetical protein
MIGGIPSYGEYVRTGQGGPEGTCQACQYAGPMEHGQTGYLCAKCHSMKLILKLKDDRVYHQMFGRVDGAAAAKS